MKGLPTEKCGFVGKELRESRLLSLPPPAGARLAQFLTHKYALLSTSLTMLNERAKEEEEGETSTTLF